MNRGALKKKKYKKKVLPIPSNPADTIPRSVEHAFYLDKANGNKLSEEAIAKEMAAINGHKVFRDVKQGELTRHEDGWQKAPLNMIFTIKGDGRRKARLVLGGHRTTADDYDTYADTVGTRNSKLQSIYL